MSPFIFVFPKTSSKPQGVLYKTTSSRDTIATNLIKEEVLHRAKKYSWYVNLTKHEETLHISIHSHTIIHRVMYNGIILHMLHATIFYDM